LDPSPVPEDTEPGSPLQKKENKKSILNVGGESQLVTAPSPIPSNNGSEQETEELVIDDLFEPEISPRLDCDSRNSKLSDDQPFDLYFGLDVNETQIKPEIETERPQSKAESEAMFSNSSEINDEVEPDSPIIANNKNPVILDNDRQVDQPSEVNTLSGNTEDVHVKKESRVSRSRLSRSRRASYEGSTGRMSLEEGEVLPCRHEARGCKETFTDRKLLHNHARTCSARPATSHTCQQKGCSKRYYYIEDYANHLKKIHKLQVFLCKECETISFSVEEALLHKKKEH